MDSTQDPFTRRMLQRAASVRRSRKESRSVDGSRRKMSILQAIDDKPVKIADVADCQIGSGSAPIGDKQRTLRRAHLTTNDCLISRRSGISGFRSKSQSRSTHLTGESNPNGHCQNPQDLERSSTEYAVPRQNADSGEVRVYEKDRDRGNSQTMKLETPLQEDEEYRKDKNENRINERYSIDEAKAFAKIKKPPRSQAGGTEVANSKVESKLKKSANGAENYDEIKNSLDSTQTLNSTSLNLTTGNSTKDSFASSSYIKGFELGNVKWRGPFYAASVISQKKKVQDYLDRESEAKVRVEPSSRLSSLVEPKLVKGIHKETSTPPKMRVELKTIGKCDKPEDIVAGEVKSSAENNFANKRPGKLSLPVNTSEVRPRQKVNIKFDTIAEIPDLPITPLSAEIEKLDADIKLLELHSGFHTPENAVELSPPDRIYPNLSKIRFTPTGHSPKKLYRSPCSPEEDSESSCLKKPAVTSDEGGWNFEKNSATKSNYTPKNIENPNNGCNVSKKTTTSDETKAIINSGSVSAEIESSGLVKDSGKAAKSDEFKPNMESTRKSSLTDLSKNTGSPCPREMTVSSVRIPPDTPEGTENVGTSSSPVGKDLTLDSTIPYNVDNFLADALGDELYNTDVTYPPSETYEKSISQFNASELVSEDSTRLEKKNKRFSKINAIDEPPPQYSSTFNRTMTIYKSFTERIKNKLRPGLRTMPNTVTNNFTITEDPACEDEEIQALQQQANIQKTLMYQANKALTFCHSMKEFASSTEQVESEKSLLVAELRRAAALEEIKKLEYEMNNNQSERSCERGEVTIKDFSLPLKEDILKYEAETGDFVQWFVIVVSHGATVWATRAVSCPVQSPRIIFDGECAIPNLSPSFKITVKIYSLKMRRITYNYEDKYHLNQAEKHSRCPSPKKLILRKSERSLSPREVQRMECSTIRNTSFLLSGMVELYLHDLSLSAPWPLTSLLPNSVLRGTIELSLSCKLHLSVSHSGFLTHGKEVGGFADWNRRWCVLQGQTLRFWNYPCDQEDEEPVSMIDLTNCISEEITVVDRSLCAKARTLLIETARRRSVFDRNSTLLECRLSYTIVRNLLYCDTGRDLSLWKSKLNHAISALRDWNITNRFPDVQVSEL